MKTEQNPVTIEHVRLRRIRSIEALDIPLGKVTIVGGGNGRGKSNVLKGIAAVLSGEADNNLVMDHEGMGTVHLIAKDGRLLELQAVADLNGKVSVKRKISGEGGRGNAGVEWVKANSRAKLVNPAQLMSCDDKTRYEEFAAAVPILLTPEDLAGALEVPVDEIEITKAPLDEIKLRHKEIYDRRTTVNSDVRSAEGTIKQIEATLPAGDTGDYQAAVAQAESDLAEAHRRYQEQKDAAQLVMMTARAEADKAREQARAKVEELYRKKCEEIDKARADAHSVAEHDHHRALEEIGAEMDSLLSDCTAKVASARTIAEQAARIDEQRQILARMKQEVQVKSEESDRYTRTLQRLEKLKKLLIDDIPIPGLTFEDGVALIDGRPWECANTARRIEIVTQVAAMGAGPLGIVIFDNLEALDPESFTHVIESALAVPAVQFIGARAMTDEDGNPLPLTIIDINDDTLPMVARGMYEAPLALNGAAH